MAMRPRRPRWKSGLWAAVGASTVASLVAIAAIAVAWVVLIDGASRDEAKAEAARAGEIAGRVTLAPFITDALIEGDPGAATAMAAAVGNMMDNDDVVRVKIWTEDGTIVWSDSTEAIGQRFELLGEELEALQEQTVEVELGGLDKDENAFERDLGEGELFQVYVGMRSPNGIPVLVETYYSSDLVDSRVNDLRRRYLPLLLGGLAVLALAQIPLARALHMQLTRLQRDRERLLEQVIETGDAERRRIASEVHDGAVQELIGISYSLSAAAEHAAPPTAATLNDLAGSTRHVIRSLRALLHSIYPVAVPAGGWQAGVDDIVTALREHGTEVTFNVATTPLPKAAEMLLLRVTREALRNVELHAAATRVDIDLEVRGPHLVLEVTDNGVGFDQQHELQRRLQGHLGLQLVRDLAAGMDAVVSVESEPGSGATVRLEMETR